MYTIYPTQETLQEELKLLEQFHNESIEFEISQLRLDLTSVQQKYSIIYPNAESDIKAFLAKLDEKRGTTIYSESYDEEYAESLENSIFHREIHAHEEMTEQLEHEDDWMLSSDDTAHGTIGDDTTFERDCNENK